MGIPSTLRNPLSKFHKNAGTAPCEKQLLRQAFDAVEPDLLPKHILWRKKEAFSDGVSGDEGTWFTLIDEMVVKLMDSDDYNEKKTDSKRYFHNPPANKRTILL